MILRIRKDQYSRISGPLYPSDPLFFELGILKVQDVFKLHTSKFIYELPFSLYS